MTLTSIIPSLRRTLPDPLRTSVWPIHTVATTTDLLIDAVSMRRLVDICHTPCVHTADGVIPGTGGRRVSPETVSVVMVSVTDVIEVPGEGRVVLVDACLDGVAAQWEDVRLIGRASCAHDLPATVLSGAAMENASACVAGIRAPSDLTAGDILAVPCRGMVRLRDLRPHECSETGVDRAQWLGLLP